MTLLAVILQIKADFIFSDCKKLWDVGHELSSLLKGSMPEEVLRTTETSIRRHEWKHTEKDRRSVYRIFKAASLHSLVFIFLIIYSSCKRSKFPNAQGYFITSEILQNLKNIQFTINLILTIMLIHEDSPQQLNTGLTSWVLFTGIVWGSG